MPQGSPKRLTMSTFQIRMRFWHPTAWLGILQKAGLEHLRFHDLRHAHASLMLQQNVHPKVVSERLGHSSVGITLDTYSHLLPTLQVQAAAQLDGLLSPASGLG